MGNRSKGSERASVTLVPDLHHAAQRQHAVVRAAHRDGPRRCAGRVLPAAALHRDADDSARLPARGRRRHRPGTENREGELVQHELFDPAPLLRLRGVPATGCATRATTPNGVFGAKIMWPYFAGLVDGLSTVPGCHATGRRTICSPCLSRPALRLAAPDGQGAPSRLAVARDPDVALAHGRRAAGERRADRPSWTCDTASRRSTTCAGSSSHRTGRGRSTSKRPALEPLTLTLRGLLTGSARDRDLDTPARGRDLSGRCATTAFPARPARPTICPSGGCPTSGPSSRAFPAVS